MADNVSDALKNLDKRIKNVDQSLSTMIQRYERFMRAVSKKDKDGMESAWESLTTGANNTATKFRTLEKEIKILKAQAKDPESLRRLDKLFRQLNSASGAWASVLASVNRGQQTTQVFAERLARAFDKGQRALAAFNNEQVRGAAASNKTKQDLAEMLPLLQKLGYAFGIAFSAQGLVQFGRKLVETRGEFELQQVALRSILQNKQVADEIWDKTMQAALQSPFTAMQLTKYTKQLAAYRIESDKLFDTTKRLADVSAGLGVDMQRLILAYGQVKAANYLRASEIRQFTEAGVNVLGELSDYFARTRGEMMSTEQVMKMVQKRMVKFEDVEAIFKHMTDEGGIFYNMQDIQSQTVRGQINKLHDAYDQMLNSIGQGNQGVLKNMVSIANNLVRNWREFAGTIQGIAWAFIFVQLGKTAIGIHRIGTEAITAGSKVSWLARQLGKLRKKSKGYEFGKVFSKANVVLAAGAAVAFVTGKFLQHLNAVRQINEKYNELSLRAYETQENLSGIQKKLSQNNQNIERLNKVSKKSKEQEEELVNARKQNAEIVNRLKRDYPELADGMNIRKNGVVTLTSAISDYNEQLEYTILLNQLAKGNAWNDDLQTNVTEMTQSLQSAEQTLASYQTLAKSILLQMKNMDFGFGQEGRAKRLKKLLEGIIGLEKGDYEGLNKLLRGDPLRWYSYLTQTRSWRIAFQPIFLDKHNIDATKKQLERSESVLYDMLKISVRRDKEYMDEISKKWGGDIDKFIHNNAERIQKNVDDGKKDTFKAIREYGLQMGFAFKGAQDIFNQTLNRGNTSLFGGLGFRFFEYPGVGETGTDQEKPEEKQSKIDAAWRRRINLLEEMKKRYDELSESAYGYAKSNTTVRTEFGKSWGKIFGGVLSMNAVQFTSAAEMEAAFETILAKAGAASSAVKEEIQKKADSYGARVPIDVQVRIREDFGRQMEEAFGNYELTLELQKLNIPEDAVKDLFPDFDYTSIGALQDIMEKFYNDRQKKDEKGNVLFSKDDLDAYKKWSDKIDSEILKMRKEKAQQYSRYLEKEYSERAKVEMKYAKDVAFVTANMSDETQRNNILSNLQKKYQDDINELNWKSFKESDFYVEMMDDITSLPKEYTQMMLDKINEILQHPETLLPRALKEAINARQKVLEAQMNFEPLDVMRTSVAQIRTAMNDVGGTSWKDTKEKIHEQVTATQEQIDKLEEEARCWDDTAAKMQVYEDAVESVSVARGKLGSSTTKKLEEEGASLESVLKEYKNLRTGFDEERQQLLIDFKKENLTDEEDAIRKQLIDKGYLSESGELTSNGKDILNYLDRQNSYYQEQIDLLNELIDKEKELQSIREGQAGTDAEMQRGVGGVGTAANARARAQEARDKASEPRKRIQSLKDYLKAFTNFNESFAKFNAAINSTLNAVQGMGNAFYDMFDALGGETDALTDGWKEFGGTMITQITQTLTMIPLMVAAFTAAEIDIKSALGIIGLIAEALQLLFVAIGAIAKLHDAHYEKEIENQQKKIDALKDAYARLERQIERTWNSVSYMQTYEQQVENIRAQIRSMEAQLAAEEAKKNTDDNAVRQYQRDIQDAYDQLEELEQKSIEVFGGIGEEGYRSAAQGFVEAWKSAFLETGDGLQGLQDHFDEFLQDWFVKQATMRIAGGMLEPVFRQIDAAVDKYGDGGTSAMLSEIERVRDMAAAIFPDLSLALEDLAGMFGGFGEGSLSGLAAGIQGMTEEQANILEAYWNSVRMYTANLDGNVERIANILGAGGSATNPQLQQLQIIAQNTQAIHTLLEGVTKSGHPEGGRGIKVFNN